MLRHCLPGPRRRCVFLMLMLAAVPLISTPQRAVAACKIGVVGEIPLEANRYRPIAIGSINGEAIRVSFDTGATVSFIWGSAARRLGLKVTQLPGSMRFNGIGGQATTGRTQVKDLRMGNFYAKDVSLFVIDNPHAAQADSSQAARPDAPALVFGDDLFSHFDTEFDLGHDKIRLLKAEDCKPDQTPYWAETFSLADIDGWDPQRPQIRSTVLVNGVRVSAVFDTGAPRSTITRLASERAGVTPWTEGAKALGKIGGVGSEREDVWVGRFKSFAIGDEGLANVPLMISDLFHADTEVQLGSRIATQVDGLPTMLIGCDFFHSHHVLVLSHQRKMVFTYNGGPVFETSAARAQGQPGPQPSDGR